MTDTALQAYTTKLDEEIVAPLQQVLVGRHLVHAPEPKGFGVTAVEWSKILDMSEGMVSFGFTSGNEDAIDFQLASTPIPVYWKDYKVDRRLYEGFIQNGIDVDSATALAAGLAAAKVENAAIIRGVPNGAGGYRVNGLYEGAGSDVATNYDFATFGNATKAVAAALETLDDNDVPTSIPFNYVLAPTQKSKLNTSRSTMGQKELPDVMEMLNGGNIISSGALDAGTGMMVPDPSVGKAYIDFYLTQDWKNELGVDSQHPLTAPVTGRVFSAGVLRMKQAKVVCTTSSIGTA